MELLKLFLLCWATQYTVIAQNADEWSIWRLNLFGDTYRRTRTCLDSDINCIKQEAVSVKCLSKCQDIARSYDNLEGFSSCDGLCYNGDRERELNCSKNQNKTCTLTQTKRCYNDIKCYGTWSSWNAADGITNCSDQSPKRFIRTCSYPCDPPETTGGPVRQSKLDFDPACTKAAVTSATTTTLSVSTVLPQPCKNDDCKLWDEWNTWSTCQTQTDTHTRRRFCRQAARPCEEELIDESTKTCEPILILGLSIGISAVVILGVIAVFCVKCRQVRHRRKKEMSANTNLLYKQAPIPSTHSSTFTLYNAHRQLPSVPGTAQATSQIPLPSPPYSRPFDAINNSPPPQIRMTNDSIYATITND